MTLLKLKRMFVVMAMALLALSAACKEAPKVSHAVINKSDASCLSCHQSGATGAPVMSHSNYDNCLRCHKETGKGQANK